MADEYASDLILPRYLLDPILKDVTRLTVKSLNTVADEFKASKTATLIKAVTSGYFPVMMVCTARSGRKWFNRSPSVPDRWFPRDAVTTESHAFDMVYGGRAAAAAPRSVKASAWFDSIEAGGLMMQEESYGLPDAEVMTILTFTDKKMLASHTRD